MPTKIRKQIYIEPHQEQLLKAIANLKGISEAEIIRACIDLHIGSITTPQTNIAAWEAELAFINSIFPDIAKGNRSHPVNGYSFSMFAASKR